MCLLSRKLAGLVETVCDAERSATFPAAVSTALSVTHIKIRCLEMTVTARKM